MWFACTVCSSAMTQFAAQPALVHARPTNACPAPKLSAGAAYLGAAGQSILLPSYTAKSHRAQAELHSPRTTRTQDPK